MKKQKLEELIKKVQEMPENYKLVLAGFLSLLIILTFFLVLVFLNGILGQKLF